LSFQNPPTAKENTSYTCDTLRGENRLRMSENRVLRGIFGPKREEVEGG
jgi:hypothetical protein